MAKEVENQGIINMTDRQVFDELINLHAKAAGESLSSILKADIEISGPEISEITVKEVEYGILEPAIFVKSCLLRSCRQYGHYPAPAGYAGVPK